MIVHTVSVAQPDLPCDVVHTVGVAYPLHFSVEQPDLTRLCCTTSPSARRFLTTTRATYRVDVLQQRDLLGDDLKRRELLARILRFQYNKLDLCTHLSYS